MKEERLTYTLVFVIIFILPISITADQCPAPATEGSSYTFSLDIYVDSDTQQFVWSYINQSGQESPVVNCSVASGCQHLRDTAQYGILLSEKGGNKYEITFTIKHVRRDIHGLRFTLTDGAKTLEECAMEVHYPPVASIKDCPSGSGVKDGYIKNDTIATCQCHLTDVGNPPGQPQWFDVKGLKLEQYNSNGSLSLLTVYSSSDPPHSPPIMSLNNNVINTSVVTIISGQRLVVKCRVDGGYPAVSNVTTICEGHQDVANGPEATQTLDVDKNVNQEICICMAEHVTGSYHKTTEFTLDVQYGTAIIHYTANFQSQSLEVEDGDSLILFCEAEGNPRPSLSIIGQRSKKSLTLQDTNFGGYTKTSDILKVLSCRDTDTYICMADNGVGDSVQQKVSVFVKCKPELSSSGVKREFEMTTTKNLVISIDIIGYPKPTGYNLTKFISNSTEYYVVDESRYHVNYSEKEPPEGTVVLTMISLVDEDSGLYGLTIRNGANDGLEFMFQINSMPENYPSDNETNIGLAVGIAVGCGLLLSIITFILGIKVGKRRQCQEYVPNEITTPRSSAFYDNCNVLPL